jgi:hypothetical protein
MPLQPFQNQGANLANPSQSKQFQSYLAQFLNGLLSLIQTPAWLGQILNGKAVISGTALQIVDPNLGTVTTNQTVNCQGAALVSIDVAIGAAFTLNLTNLQFGIPVFTRVVNNTGGALAMKIAATQPGGSAYSGVFAKTTAALVNMTTTGLSIAAGTNILFFGNSTPVANLYLLSL